MSNTHKEYKNLPGRTLILVRIKNLALPEPCFLLKIIALGWGVAFDTSFQSVIIHRMNGTRTQPNTVTVPKRVIISMVEAYEKWSEFMSEFEDFSLGSNKEFLSGMRKAKKEHLLGKTRNMGDLRKLLHV